MSATSHISMINVAVIAHEQLEADRRAGTVEQNEQKDPNYYLWHSDFQTFPLGMDNNPEQFAAEMRQALPTVNTLRMVFNPASFNADGTLHPQYERFLEAATAEGFKIVFCYAAGNAQRLGVYEDLNLAEMRAALQGEIRNDMRESWSKMLDWLDDHPDVAAGTWGMDIVNEPASYATAERTAGGSGEFVRLYADTMLEMTSMIQARSDAKILVSGWDYSANFDIFKTTRMGEGTVLDALREGVGEDLVWSGHLYPSWVNPEETLGHDGFARMLERQYGVLGDDDILITETNAPGIAANDSTHSDAAFWMVRAYEAFADRGIGLGWFPGVEAGASSFLSIDGDGTRRFLHPDSFAHGMNGFLLGQTDAAHAGDETLAATLIAGRVRTEAGVTLDVDGIGYAAGFDGNDVIHGRDRAMNMLYGGQGNDRVCGRAGRDHLFGQGGADTLVGGTGHDVLMGGDGADCLKDGVGNDLLSGGRGADHFVLAEGNDTITDFSSAEGDVIMDGLQAWTDADLSSVGSLIDADGDGRVDDLVVQRIQGRLTILDFGYGKPNGLIEGTAGNDRIGVDYVDVNGDVYRNRNFTIEAGAGNDTIIGVMAADRIYGQDGDDSIFGAAGNDTIFGGNGRDSLAGDLGADVVSGEAGDDVVSGGAGNDLLTGGTGYDTLRGDGEADRLFGEDGNDVLEGGMDDDMLDGGADDDQLTGATGNDTLRGGLGSDTLRGDGEADWLHGDEGNDILEGGVGNDQLNGGADDDQLTGAYGNDTLTGGVGNDTLRGDGDADCLNGDEGNDVLEGGLGNDQLNGGADDDQLTGAYGNDTLRGGVGNDTLRGDGDADRLYGNEGNDILEGGAGSDLIEGGADADKVTGSTGEDTLMGGLGNDTINGDTESDQLYGDEGNDVLDGGAASDLVDGGADADKVIGGTGRDTLSGGDGNDTINGDADGDRISGDEGNDVLDGGAGYDSIFGGSGDDRLVAGVGGAMMDGGAGNDRLVGQMATYTPMDLTGGEGADVFEFTGLYTVGATRAVIQDFDFDQDQLYLAGRLGFDAIDSAYAYKGLTEVDDGVVLRFGDAQILFMNAQIEDFA